MHVELMGNVVEPVNDNKKETFSHRKKKRAWLSVFLSGVSLLGLFWLLFFISPVEPQHLFGYAFSPIPVFLVLLSLFLFFGTHGILRSQRHAWLITLLVLSALLLRLNNLTEPLFFFLLLGVFLMVELLLRQKY